MNKKTYALAVLILIALLIGASRSFATGFAEPEEQPALAPVGTAFTYQGQFVDNGSPASGSYDFRFQLFNALSGGSQVGGTVTKDDVSVSDGKFTVELDFGNVFNGSALWLFIGVRDGASTGAFTSLSPRQPLTPVPYAINADRLDGLEAVDFADSSHDHWGQTWTGSGTGLTLSGDYVGLSAHATQYGVYGESNAAGVYGESNSTAGRGVFGSASAASGTTHGVYGLVLSTSGRGVYGIASAGSGTTYGVHGNSYSTSGVGVYGEASFATSGTTKGVYGLSSSTSGRGVEGFASAASGTTYGVYGQSYSTSGVGVYAFASATSGTAYGLYGLSYSTDGRGVYGRTTSVSGTTYGVYGNSYSTSGYDFYAGGNGTNYGPFTGAHEVRLAASFPLDVKAGMIVSATGEAQARHGADGGVEISSTLPTVRLADTAEDKSVFGALVSEVTLPEDHWYEAGENERFASVNALGEGRVWVSSINGGIEAGDYITTSALPGYGQRQNDDLLHSYTLGKATETVNWDKVTETVMYNGQEYEVYLIAVVYTSG